MKNKLLILALLVIVLTPQVASAAWWNPFSWKVFINIRKPKVEMVKTATSTGDITSTTNEQSEIEKLRAEVEELKKNQTNQKSTNTPTKINSQKTSTSAKEENFSSSLVISYTNKADLLVTLIDAVDEITSYVDQNIDDMRSIKNKTNSYAQGLRSAGKDTEILDIFVEEYADDIEMMNVYKNYFVNTKSNIQNVITVLRNSANNTRATYVSRTTLIKEIESLNNNEFLNSIGDNVFKEFDKYKKYRKSKDDEYENAFAMLQGMLDGNKSSAPTYVSAPLPTIQIPKTTNTYCNVYGNSISCDSYSY